MQRIPSPLKFSTSQQRSLCIGLWFKTTFAHPVRTMRSTLTHKSSSNFPNYIFRWWGSREMPGKATLPRKIRTKRTRRLVNLGDTMITIY